ncbi:MAG: DUF5666 domain-containing protein [Marinobacter sp.]
MNPKSIQSATRYSLSVLAIGILAACGGGGGSSGNIGVADGGIRGTGSSVGPVSGFGSVIVNGITFDTDQILNGQVESNDGIECERGCENRLQKGMILRVDGEWREDGTGEAGALEYDDTFRGVATNVIVEEKTSSGEPVAGNLTILGQLVTFDRRSVIRLEAESGAEPVLDGKLIRVSAWRNGNNYRASFIGEIKPLSEDWVELEGPVTEFDPVDRQFQIGTQVINYVSDDVFVDDIDKLLLESGTIFVEVEGDEINGTVTARTIRRADSRRFLGQENEDLELSGPVENYSTTSSEFLINGVTVVLTDNTEFDDFSRSRIEDGLLIQVEGEFVNGVVVAEEVELLEGDAEVEADVTSEGNLPNSWVVGGVTVVVTSFTLIDADDDSSEKISVGSYLEVEGIERETDDGVIYVEALDIEIEEESEDEFELQGRVRPESFFPSSPSLTMLGLTMSIAPGAIKDEDDDEGSVYDCQYLEVGYERLSPNEYRAEEIECGD